jgi:lipoprotein-anchoring transpeptidase ErfK/SrfK
MTQLQSGLGMPGGPENPLGPGASYLYNRTTIGTKVVVLGTAAATASTQ